MLFSKNIGYLVLLSAVSFCSGCDSDDQPKTQQETKQETNKEIQHDAKIDCSILKKYQREYMYNAEASIASCIELYQLSNDALPTKEVASEKCLRGQADPWGNPFFYDIPGKHNPKTFDLYSAGPDGKLGTFDDIANWSINEREVCNTMR